MTYPERIQAIADVLLPELEVRHPVELQELDPAGKHAPIKFGTRDALTISFDQAYAVVRKNQRCLADWLHPLLQGGKNVRRSCDYVVFYEKGETLWVLLVELKSRRADAARKQIAQTQLLVEYLLKVVQHAQSEWDDSVFANTQYRGIVFTQNAHTLKANRHGTVSYVRDYPKIPALAWVTLPPREYRRLDVFCA